MQTFVVRPHAFVLCTGLVFSLAATMTCGRAWAQDMPGDAAKPAAEQAVAGPAGKPVESESKAAADDTKRAEGEQISETAAPVPISENAKPAQDNAKPQAAETSAAASETTVQAPAVAKAKPTPDKAAGEAPILKPAASDATPSGASSDANKSAPPPVSEAVARPADREKSGARKDVASPSGHRDRHSDDARRSRHGETPEANHKVGCQNFRTYNAQRATYRGYDGRVHRCP